MQEEVKHMISLHINADRLGYTQQGDPRVGNFQDTRQREYAGQLVLQAISHFLHHLSAHRNSSYQLHKLEGIAGLKAAEADSEKADQHISEALNQIQQWSSFFKVIDLDCFQSLGTLLLAAHPLYSVNHIWFTDL